MGRVLIVTPLPKEKAALEAAFADLGARVTERDGRIPLSEIPALEVVLGAAGHGKAQFGVATQHLLDRESFAAVVVAGAAGALDPTLNPGDVVIGTESVEHDYRTRFHGEGLPPRHPASLELFEAVLEGASPEGFAVHTGPIAGGDEDIIEADRAAALRERTGALCVAWEGPGGARAAAFSGVPFLEVRAVTDRADSDAPDSYRVTLPRAVGNVARVLAPWLRSHRHL